MPALTPHFFQLWNNRVIEAMSIRWRNKHETQRMMCETQNESDPRKGRRKHRAKGWQYFLDLGYLSFSLPQPTNMIQHRTMKEAIWVERQKESLAEWRDGYVRKGLTWLCLVSDWFIKAKVRVDPEAFSMHKLLHLPPLPQDSCPFLMVISYSFFHVPIFNLSFP